MEWGVFVAVVMMFGLKTEVFGEYIPAFMQVFLDNFPVYGAWKDHLHHLRSCLERCRAARLSLNPATCVFGVTRGALLRHIVSGEGIAVDPGKIDDIIKSPTPKNAKALGQILGQLRWHNRMIRHLADFATPLHAEVRGSRPVYYSNWKLSTGERNYSTTEREALGMIYSINKFHHYLLGKKFTFHVDHVALLYLI